MTTNTFALNRHTRGWGYVTPLYSDLATRLVYVRDEQNGFIYPAYRRELRDAVLLSRRNQDALAAASR